MAKKSEERVALVEVPIADVPRDPLYRLDMGKLSERHRNTLNRIWQGLRKRHAMLADGRHVESVPDAVRWLLDQVEESADAA